LGKWGVLIDLAGLNAVTIAADKNTAKIGDGASIGDSIAAVDAAGVLIITGNCICIGALGAMLGSGYGTSTCHITSGQNYARDYAGDLIREVGFGVDNIISLRVVVSTGEILDVSATSHPDLLWAMRGAGPNFGIAVSATVNATPANEEDRNAYINNLFSTPDKLEQVAQAVEDLPPTPQQRVYLVLTSSDEPLNKRSILITGLLRKGTNETVRAAIKPLYDLRPVFESSEIIPYTHWNDANIGFRTRGGWKPSCSSNITSMSAQKWPKIWELYKAFQAKRPNSAVLIERYNLTKAVSEPASSVAMNEALKKGAFSQAIVVPWYDDVSLDAEALKFGSSVRVRRD
jgi:FAD/FMN-containing dehydrogenase